MFFVWIMWETGSDRLVLFFLFLFFHICLFWFNFILRIRFCFLFCVWIIMWETERIREKKKSGGERKNWYNSSWDNFLSKKIDLKVLQCSLDLENYYSNFIKKLEKLRVWRNCWSMNSNIWWSKNGFTVAVGDALSHIKFDLYKYKYIKFLNGKNFPVANNSLRVRSQESNFPWRNNWN